MLALRVQEEREQISLGISVSNTLPHLDYVPYNRDSLLQKQENKMFQKTTAKKKAKLI